ncbi:MAG: electron transfer flavoprotein subunit beta/FixA family protein [archaeon]|nr:electron transfer flavoprotein subunit beta/FixA family protein [archaeon]
MLNIIVCIKQVPNTDKVNFDWKKGALIRNIDDNIMNPDDYHAIELALQLKEEYQGKISIITMGPPQAEDVLKEAYSLGDVDECILVTDPRFAGSDTHVTTKILNRTIKKIGDFDIIITGFETIDGNTSQVSYQLAEIFDIPHITQSHNVSIENNNAIIERLFGHEYQKVKVKLPILIAVKRGSNTVRHPKLVNIKKSIQKEIKILKMEDIGGNEEEYGIMGSPTITIEGEIISHKRKKQEFEGTPDEKIDQLILKLKKYGFLNSY